MQPILDPVAPHRGLSGRVGAVSTRGAELRTYETMELSADSGPAVTIYTADAGSASERALDHLAGVADHAGRH